MKKARVLDDGQVKLWDVYTQTWRVVAPGEYVIDEVLAALPEDERETVLSVTGAFNQELM